MGITTVLEGGSGHRDPQGTGTPRTQGHPQDRGTSPGQRDIPGTQGTPWGTGDPPHGTAPQDAHLKAVRYSTSPMGGSTPPVQAMLTL